MRQTIRYARAHCQGNGDGIKGYHFRQSRPGSRHIHSAAHARV